MNWHGWRRGVSTGSSRGSPVRCRTDCAAGLELADDRQGLAWFPAWALSRYAALAGSLGQAQSRPHTAAEQTLRLMLELLGLERQGRHRESVARRKVLRDLHPSLDAAYMASR